MFNNILQKTIFFYILGSKLFRYTRFKLDAGFPKKITIPFFQNLDAAVNYNGVLYVFKVCKYCSYIQSQVNCISILRYFPTYFISNHLFSKHFLKVFPYPIFLKFSPLNAEINMHVVSSLYKCHISLFLLLLQT